MEEYKTIYEVFLPKKKPYLNGTKPLKLTPIIGNTEKHVKPHHGDASSKIQTMGDSTDQIT